MQRGFLPAITLPCVCIGICQKPVNPCFETKGPGRLVQTLSSSTITMFKRGRGRGRGRGGGGGGGGEQQQQRKPSESDEDRDSNSITCCELSKNRKVAVRTFNGNIGVDIREFYIKDGKTLPGRKGILLPLDQWEVLRNHVDAIDDALENN